MAEKPSDLVQGTLDMLILKTLALEPMHGYGIAVRLEQMSKGVFRLNAGSLFVAFHRLQRAGLIRSEWKATENSRRAKYCALTDDGRNVLAYSVAQRTQEIGVRMALGARSADVLRMLLKKALVLISTGIVLGGAGAFNLTRVLTRFLFELKPIDLPTLAAVALTLALTTLAACYVHARRAMRGDPMVALRYE
jgi:PadR family transcriptional regulator PadR